MPDLLDEYTTDDQMEMAYIHYLGCFSYDFDRENEKKVKMIVKGDVRIIRAKIRDMWEDRNDFRKMINAYKSIKRSLWVGNKYDPNFYQNRNQNERTIKKVHQ